MGTYVLGRTLRFIPLLLLISLVGFFAVRLTGDPLAAYTVGGHLTPENLAALKARFGLDKPLAVQYLYWLGAVLQGNLGNSFVTGQPVLKVILPRLGNTAILLASILTVTLALSIPIGIYSAVDPDRDLLRGSATLVPGLRAGHLRLHRLRHPDVLAGHRADPHLRDPVQSLGAAVPAARRDV